MLVSTWGPKSQLKYVWCLFNYIHEQIDKLTSSQGYMPSLTPSAILFSCHRKLCVFIHGVVPLLTDSVRGHLLFMHSPCITSRWCLSSVSLQWDQDSPACCCYVQQICYFFSFPPWNSMRTFLKLPFTVYFSPINLLFFEWIFCNWVACFDNMYGNYCNNPLNIPY